jgi:hypothetical protein
LISLPANSFEVVAMSLVLNYLPSPALRELMVENARKLLIGPPSDLDGPPGNPLPSMPHRSGLLLIAEKISIFDWKESSGRSGSSSSSSSSSTTASPIQAPPSRHEWTQCICSLGFELVTYQTNVYAGHHVHLFAFRVVPAPLPSEVTNAGDEQQSKMKSRDDRPRLRIKADAKLSEAQFHRFP